MARSLVPSVLDAGITAVHGDPFLALHREVNRLFDDVMRGVGPAGGSLTGALVPRMDVSESGQDICIEMELPGVSEQDVHVELTDDLLIVRGEKRAVREDAQHHLTERSFGGFARSVRLPFAPRPDQVQAGFANGVLTITLPKASAEARVHRIQVQPGAGTGQSSASQGAAAAMAGHPTPDTTQAGMGQGNGSKEGASQRTPS
jgi:HSP20 family protein